MGSFSDAKVHQWLACIADTAWVSLHYESPGLNSINDGEISGGGYHRVLVGFSVPANRAIWSLDDAKFTGLLKTRLTHFGIYDNPYTGTLQAYGELANTGVVILDGQGYIVPAGQLALSVG